MYFDKAIRRGNIVEVPVSVATAPTFPPSVFFDCAMGDLFAILSEGNKATIQATGKIKNATDNLCSGVK